MKKTHSHDSSRPKLGRGGPTFKETKLHTSLVTLKDLMLIMILTKWLWNPHVGKLGKNIVGVGVCKIVEQMGRANPNNWMKTVTFEKWLTMTPNWRCYKHPPIAPPNLGADLTSLKCYKPLFYTWHKSLHQTNEDENLLWQYL
jgi:hypothetical protein